ncbi:MAG: aminoglycoside phosphotransferase [Acidobacteria bacterium]|nr:aminoglycoside phosphotransferase [Acidobacteriota bacterium]|tara:strand:+ start:3191 stop:4267 length:1077 start_codon:yes stop_codon:yes gene_type:complete
MSKRAIFEASHPGVFFLDERDPAGLAAFLRHKGWLASDEAVRGLSKPGEGNMNLTLRVATSQRTLIAKQARPWVEKYEHIAAPPERALVEGRFYELMAQYPALRDRMPRLLGFAPEERILLLEDLGSGADYTDLYAGERLSEADLDALVDMLASLHRAFVGFQDDGLFTNRAMRELNHQHIFRVPLDASNGLDLDALTPGLSGAATKLREDTDFVAAVETLGRVYLRDGGTLLHGDFFPGSWLRTAEGPRIIDPEFCFLGAPEFDVGVLVAHLLLADQPPAIVDRALTGYAERIGTRPDEASRALVMRFAGVEMMRRLIGVAQLPLTASLARKRTWLRQVREMVSSAARQTRSSGGGG